MTTAQTLAICQKIADEKNRENNEKELKKLRAFKPPIDKGDKLLYYLKTDYILTSTAIHEKRQALRYFATARIENKTNSVIYYLLPMPADTKLKHEIKHILSNAGMVITTALTLKDKDSITATYLNKNKELPYYHADRIKIMREKFKEVERLGVTTYQKTQPLKVPIFFCSKTAEDFVKGYASKDLYKLYTIIIMWHLTYNTCLFRQGSIDTIAASESDVRKLMPNDMRIKYLTSYISRACVITKSNDTILFQYDMENLENLYKKQYVALPLHIFNPKTFHNKNLGYNGKYFLFAFLYGYHLYTNPYVNYKPSTLIQLAHLNKARGTKYLLESINKRLKYLYTLGLLEYEPAELTADHLKEDKAIKYYLNKPNLIYRHETSSEK